MIAKPSAISLRSPQTMLQTYLIAWLAYGDDTHDDYICQLLDADRILRSDRITELDTPLTVLEDETTAWVGVGGTDNLLMWYGYFAMYGAMTHPSINGAAFSPFVLGAISALTRLQRLQIPDRKRIVCTGHSYGGSVAHVLATMLRRQRDANVTCVQWSAPRIGNAAYVAGAMVPTLHYACEGDIIPLIPPPVVQLTPVPIVGTVASTYTPSGPITWLLRDGHTLQVPVPEGTQAYRPMRETAYRIAARQWAVPHDMYSMREYVATVLARNSEDMRTTWGRLVASGFLGRGVPAVVFN